MNKTKIAPRGDKRRDLINQAIRAPKVLCIDHNNNNLGIIPTHEALRLAKNEGLDLVQVAIMEGDRPPTCRIIDFGKFKYEQSKNKKESDKKQRQSLIKVKEIKFRPSTDDNDLKIKAKQAENFLSEGYKVKVSITFKGREIAHQDVGARQLEDFLNLVPNGQLEGKSCLDKNNLTIYLIKK